MFSSKRKTDGISFDDESPSKYVAIACDSSDEDNYHRIEETKRVRRISCKPKNTGFLSKKNCETQFQIFSDDSCDDESTQYSGLWTPNSFNEPSREESTTYEEDHITEFTTPVKDSSPKDTESPVKTPVLKPYRGRCDDGDEIAEFVSPVSNVQIANNREVKSGTSRRRRRRRSGSGRNFHLDHNSEASMVSMSTQSLLVLSDKSDEENEFKQHSVRQSRYSYMYYSNKHFSTRFW